MVTAAVGADPDETKTELAGRSSDYSWPLRQTGSASRPAGPELFLGVNRVVIGTLQSALPHMPKGRRSWPPSRPGLGHGTPPVPH